MSRSYVIYQCDVCHRQAEVENHGDRPDPVRCNITLKCRGKLQRVRTKSSKKFLVTPVVPGVQDYVQRGRDKSPSTAVQVPPSVSINTGSENILVLAALRRTVVNGLALYVVTDDSGGDFVVEQAPVGTLVPQSATIKATVFEVTSNSLDAVKYTYVSQKSVFIVSGRDHSPSGLNMRFTENDQVTVYVNGVELPATAFDRSVNHQITFTPPIYDSSNVVDVFVYKSLESARVGNSITLTFKALKLTDLDDRELRGLSCWGNVSGVTHQGETTHLLYCTDLTPLNATRSYVITRFEAISGDGFESRTVDSSTLKLLLGREPYGFTDKKLREWVDGKSLTDETAVIVYVKTVFNPSIKVNYAGTTKSFDPLVPTANLAVVTPTGEQPQSLIIDTNISNKYVIGPA